MDTLNRSNQACASIPTSSILSTAMSSANLVPSPVPMVGIPTSSPGSSHARSDVMQRLSPSVGSPGSLQSNDQMEVERQHSPQNVREERSAHTPQHQDPHPMMMERDEKIVILTDPSGSVNKDIPSPALPTTMIVNSSTHKPPDGATEMKQIVFISESSPVSISKDGHLMPPSPAHTPQPVSQATQHLAPEIEHGVRALVVFNEKGETVQDQIMQFMPNQVREESPIMKGESYVITCGSNKGELYWKKFICPGINAKCVKCHGVWLTPKEFVQEAGKSTLKDWKRAIRINGMMLRKMIESGEVDYYEHEKNCSNQCRSNKGSSLESTGQGSFNHSFEISDVKDNSMSVGPSLERSNSEDNASFLKTKHPMLTVQRYSQESSKSAMSSLERSSSEDSGLASSPQLDGVIMRESVATAEKVQDLQAFWVGINRSDLFDEVVQDILTQVTTIQHRVKTLPVISAEDAITMTNLANALELIPSIAQKTANHKLTVERQAEQSNHIIQDLERKLAEQKRFEFDLKRKSQHLESVMKMTPNEKRKRRTMMRLYRQKAVESRIPPSTLQQPGSSGQSSTARLAAPESMVGVHANALLRYPGSELWGPQSSTAVVHALQQVASNQMNVPSRMISLPIPPHLLSSHPDSSTYQVHSDPSKK